MALRKDLATALDLALVFQYESLVHLMMKYNAPLEMMKQKRLDDYLKDHPPPSQAKSARSVVPHPETTDENRKEEGAKAPAKDRAANSEETASDSTADGDEKSSEDSPQADSDEEPPRKRTKKNE